MPHSLASPADHGTLVVTGVDGMVGSNLALALADRFAVLGLAPSRGAGLDGCRTAAWSAGRLDDLLATIRRESPCWILHCGPFSCSSWDLPFDVPDAGCESRLRAGLAELARELRCPLTVVSTDAVFAGPWMFHGEEASPESRLPFAEAARTAEEAIADLPGVLLVRTHSYGWTPPSAGPGLIERIWESLLDGTSCSYALDHHATPILAADLAEQLLAAYQARLTGLYHVAGAERTSLFAFARDLALAFGLTGPILAADESLPAKLASVHLAESSLDTRRARRATGRPMPMLREGLDRLAAQTRNGHRRRLQGRSAGEPAPARAA